METSQKLGSQAQFGIWGESVELLAESALRPRILTHTCLGCLEPQPSLLASVMTNSEYFTLLELPIEAVASDALDIAYQKARRTWFFRQYDPEHMLQARQKIDMVEAAYQALRDPRRQVAIVREAKSEQSQSQRRTKASHTGKRPAVDGAVTPLRTKIVRDMLRAADDLKASQGGRLSEEDVARLARAGFDQGLDYADALEVADRILHRNR